MNTQIVASLLAALSLAACVAPGDFDDASNACPAPDFDAVTRTAYCSGTVLRAETTEVRTRGDALVGEPIVRVSPEWMTVAHDFRLDVPAQSDGYGANEGDVSASPGLLTGHQLAVVLHQRDGVGYAETTQFSGHFGLSDNSPAEEISIFGAVHDARTNPLIAVVHRNRRSIGFIGLETGVEKMISDNGIESLLSGASLATMEECAERVGAHAFDVQALATFGAGGGIDRDYLVISAECGSVVYGPPGEGYDAASEDYAPPLVELPREAKSLKIDEVADRLLIASGRDGLKVSALSELRDLTNAKFEEANQTETGWNNENNWNMPVDESMGGFDVGVVLAEDATTLATEAASNVTTIELGDGRLFYLNEATSREGADRYTYLVSARFNGDNVADQFEAFALSDGDVALRDAGATIDYHVVALNDSVVAVLRNVASAGGEVTSTLGIFDAPDNHPPTLVTTLRPGELLQGIEANDGRLLVVDSDTVSAYSVTIGGDPL